MKGFSADLETQSGYEASAALMTEIMDDPVQRDQLVSLLEQFDKRHAERQKTPWINDGAPLDRSSKPLIVDDLYDDLPMGAEDLFPRLGSAAATVQDFLCRYQADMFSSSGFKYASAAAAPCSGAKVAESPASECNDRQNNVAYDVDAWSKVLILAKQHLHSKAMQRASFFSRLAQVFDRNEPPEWEVEKCPITRDSLLVILHHGNDHASIGFIGNGQSAYVMVSINDTALTMNESFQDTQKFAARIADFFTEAPKSGHKAIQHMLKAL